MRRFSKTAAAILLVGLGVTLPTDVQAAPAPEVYSIIEGRDTQTDQATLVLIGKRVTKYLAYTLRLPDGTDAGTPVRSYKGRSMLVFRLPLDLPSGSYDFALTYGKRSPVTDVFRIEVTNGTVRSGSLLPGHLAEALIDEMNDADSLAGFGAEHYTDASAIDAGALSPDRFSAYDDLEMEARIGLGMDQVAPGEHDHDGIYPTRSELTDAGVLNDSGNPVDWTALKNVPDELADGDSDTTYTAGTGLALTGSVFSVTGVPWTSLTAVPADIADGDDDTTYTAGANVDIASGTIAVTSFPWADLVGVPSGLADGDNDTTYTAGTGLALSGNVFSVAGVPWTSLAAVPADIADGDDDTTYSAGKNVTIAGGSIDVPSLPWTDLTGVPSGLDDGDDDTTYTAGLGLALTGTEFAVKNVPWAQVTSVPADLADGDDDTTYKAGVHVTLTNNEFAVPSFPWTRLTGIPADIADGDADTTYTAGTGLALTGNQFAVSGVPWTSLSGVPAGFADGVDDGSYWTESGANVYRGAGRVGIGTTTPATDLHVDGYDGVLFGGRFNVGAIPATGAGTRLMWFPKKAAFRAGRVGLVATNAADWDEKAVGQYSVALGVDTRASGLSSTALGVNTTANDEASTAMGSGTTASGDTSTAMGSDSVASGDTSTAMGSDSVASGYGSTAMGYSTTASGYVSTAMGSSTTASGYVSTAMGISTTASGDNSTTMGVATTAQPWASVAIGRYNTITGSANAWVSSDPVFVVGNGTNATSRSDAFTLFKDAGLLAGGAFTTSGRSIPASGAGTRMMWYPEKAAFRAGRVGAVSSQATNWDDAGVGEYSTAFGLDTKASGYGSTAVGNFTWASGKYSIAMGWGTRASGDESVAVGHFTAANGSSSTAMGASTKATGSYSTALGSSTTASGNVSTAMGARTTAQAYASVVLGRYNTVGGTTDSWVSTDPVLVIGKGSSATNRSNALFLRKNGDLTIAGTLTENSDARLKKDVTALGGVLGKIAGIRGVTYQFKDEDSGPAGTHVGLLAQEVRDAFPELVSEDCDGTLSVAYGKFTAVLVEAVKAQQEQIEERDREIKTLRKQLGGQDVRLTRLETSLAD